MKRFSWLILIAPIVLVSCSDVFEFSPFQANVKESNKDQNAKHIGDLYLKKRKDTGDTIVFVTMSDSHDDFSDLSNAVDKINSMEDIDFAVHLGDMANKGLLTEYEIYSDIVSIINKPLITCMGNHDYRSNGDKIYAQMFGDFNFSIQYKGVQFVIFDGTRFESGRAADLDWLEHEMASSTLPKVIFSHIPPWSTDYRENETAKFKYLLENEPVIIAIHGHQHSYFYGTPLGIEVQHLIPGAINRGKLGKVTIYPDHTYKFELISF